MKILILEDDELARMGLSLMLGRYGRTFEFSQAHLLLKEIDELEADLAFIDLDLEEDLIGLEVISRLSAKGINTIALTGHEEDSIIAKAYEFGASDFLVKPATDEQIEFVINKQRLGRISTNEFNISKQNLAKLKNIFLKNQNLILTGDTGTGKTFLAKEVHRYLCELRDRADLPFVSVNCAELSKSLIESELFGHKKGAFTGASDDRKGRIEAANGGVLFIDEVGSLDVETQVKLLKVIDERIVYRVGEIIPRKVEFLLITATCENLEKNIDEGFFRNDLYQRISDIHIRLPSFCEYSSIEKLEFIRMTLKSQPRRVVISNEAMDYLCSRNWTGNLREISKALREISATCSGVIGLEFVYDYFNDGEKEELFERSFSEFEADILKFGLPAFVENLEKYIIKSRYEANGKKARATIQELKISNNMFYKFIKK